MATKLRMPLTSGNADPKFTGGTGNLVLPPDTVKKIRLNDMRKINPSTGKPFLSTGNKTIDVDPDVVKNIIHEAKAKGIDPYTALAISYQENHLDKNAPFNLNPQVYGTPTGGPKKGVETIFSQLQYAKGLQDKGLISPGEDYLLQGYNGYGKIHKGHADLEGSNHIYGYPIPDEGIDFRHNPLYGKTIISLRDEILKKHPDIIKMVDESQNVFGKAAAVGSKIKLKVRK